MSASTLGKKHICGSCSTRFYDLNKDPASCPKCGTIAQVSAGIASYGNTVKAKVHDGIDLKRYELDDDELGSLHSSFDDIETLEDDSEDDIESLSELDDRETPGHHAGHEDDVEESQLMEDMEEYDTILDDTGDEELRA